MKYPGGLVEVTSAFEAMWEMLRDDKTRASLRGKGLLEQSKISRKPFPGPPDSPDARGPDRHGPGHAPAAAGDLPRVARLSDVRAD